MGGALRGAGQAPRRGGSGPGTSGDLPRLRTGGEIDQRGKKGNERDQGVTIDSARGNETDQIAAIDEKRKDARDQRVEINIERGDGIDQRAGRDGERDRSAEIGRGIEKIEEEGGVNLIDSSCLQINCIW